jgi:hypothetical protein
MDPHSSSKQNPDSHSLKRLNPEPHKIDADLKHRGVKIACTFDENELFNIGL